MDSTNSIYPPEHYEYYPLDLDEGPMLLPKEHELVLNTGTGQATLVNWETRRFQAETRFDTDEVLIIKTLLDHWPCYTAYEELYRLLVTDDLAEQIARCLADARETDNRALFDVALHPVRSLLHACQGRLALFGLHLNAVYQRGYLLTRMPTGGNQ